MGISERRVIGVLGLLLLLAYAQAFQVRLLYDDLSWLPVDGWAWDARHLASWPYYTAAHWWGGMPASHDVIVLLHGLNGLLVYGLVRRVWGVPTALLTLALFWLHPLQTEAVVYLTGSREVVLTSWALLAVTLGLVTHRVGRWLAWPAAGVCLGLAVAVKWSGIVALLVVPSVWVWGHPGLLTRRRALGLAVGVLGALWAVAPWQLLGRHSVNPVLFAGQSAYALGAYLGLTVWPSGLALLHDWEQVARVPSLIALALLIIVWTGLAWAVRRSSEGRLGLVWVTGALAPRLLVPQPGVEAQVVTEHHLYLPWIAVWVVLAIWLPRLLAPLWRRFVVFRGVPA